VPAAFVTSTKLVAVTPAFPMAAHVQAGAAAPRGRQRGIVSALQRTVPAQMWAGGAQSRRRCGRGEPSPGADVGGGSPVPAQMWAGGAQSRRRCGRSFGRFVHSSHPVPSVSDLALRRGGWPHRWRWRSTASTSKSCPT
jgi:hypothetical protein